MPLITVHGVSRLLSLLYPTFSFTHTSACYSPLHADIADSENGSLFQTLYVTYAYAYSLMMRLKPFGLLGLGSLAILKSEINCENENKYLNHKLITSYFTAASVLDFKIFLGLP